jgi:hypothetical protein
MPTPEYQLNKLREKYREARTRNDTATMELFMKLADRIKNPPENYYQKDYFLTTVKRSLE